MIRSLLFLLILTSCHQAKAQCELIIPPDSEPIGMVADTTIAASEGYFWVCDGVTAHFIGDNSVILGETGSFIHLFGDNNTVITKDSVMVHGMNSNVYAIDGDLVDDMGTTTNIVICEEIIFHLDTAPPGGCMSLSVNEDFFSFMTLHPNPVSDELQVTFKTLSQHARMTIMDLQGRVWIERPIQGSTPIDVSALPAGLYTVEMMSDHGRLVRKIRKEN